MLILVSIAMGWALGATCCHFQFTEILTYVFQKLPLGINYTA